MPKRKRILVLRTDRVGDLTLVTPLIESLRLSYPSSFIAALVRNETRAVLDNNPNLNEILIYNPEASVVEQAKVLKEHEFSDALLLYPTRKLAQILFLAGIPNRIGVGTIFYQYLTLMHSVSRKYEPLRHEVEYNLDVGRAIGLERISTVPRIYITDEEREWASSTLSGKGISPGDLIIGINPGSGGSSPNWIPETYFKMSINLLDIPDTKIIILGSREEGEAYRELLKGIVSDRIIPIMGLPLRELISIISQLDLLISSSTGPMHIAAALQRNTVSLFCPMPVCNVTRWGPIGNKASIILPEEGFCNTNCPKDPKLCKLEGISPEKAFDAVWNLIMKPSS